MNNKTITLCGSTVFYDDMDDLKKQLESMGFEVLHPRDTAADLDESIQDLHIDESHKTDMSETGRESKYKLILSHMNAIKQSDMILVVNLEKNDKPSYIGGNTFLEMGFALAYGKKIFVYNKLPDYSPYYDELTGMLPIVINNDLSKIKEV